MLTAPDLGVIIWALLGLSFDGRSEVATYRDFAHCLALGQLSETALNRRVGAALKPLLGSWIVRKRTPDNAYAYQAITPHSARSDQCAVLRPAEFDLLGVASSDGSDPVGASDLADFCRWQLECGQRGWTADPLRRIAERWGVTHPTVAASRDRLVSLELLKTVPRPGRFSDLIWIRELYETGDDSFQEWWHRPQTGSIGPRPRGRHTAVRVPDAQGHESSSLAALRQSRADRRHRALVDLTASPRLGHQRRSVRSEKHEVYLFHFPDEACFKVGITHAASHRIAFFASRSGILVERVSVENRAMAELVEADVLALVEEWHQLGATDRPGGGYTEMWRETGPSVDLESIRRRAIDQVAQLREAIAGAYASEAGA